VSVNETLAGYSNLLLYSAMTVYAGAMASFASDLAVSGRQAKEAMQAAARAATRRATDEADLDRAGADVAPVLVGAGASGGRPVMPPRSGAGRSAGERPVSAVAPARRKLAGIAMSLTWLAFGLHAASVVVRGISVDRPPWGNMFEFATAGAAVVTGVFLVVCLTRDLRFLGLFVTAPVLLTLGLAVTVLYTAAGQLVPALKSYWLAIHVSVAFIASALLTLAFSATVLYLVQSTRERWRESGERKVGMNFMDALPNATELDRAAYRLHAIAFPLWTFTIVAGAIWAEQAWGHYWSWDPKEVWSFVIWVVYAGYLHARATRGWGARKAAYIACVGFACLLFNFLVVNIWIVGLHSYAGVS
jgi:cytochrome c-type biogenesis protein CcsB